MRRRHPTSQAGAAGPAAKDPADPGLVRVGTGWARAPGGPGDHRTPGSATAAARGPWNYGPINYYGYNENPIWNPGFNQWGFDFFGVWIPL